MLPSIEIPQTMKILPLPPKAVTPTPPSAVTVVEISDPTAVGETIEVIGRTAVARIAVSSDLAAGLFSAAWVWATTTKTANAAISGR